MITIILVMVMILPSNIQYSGCKCWEGCGATQIRGSWCGWNGECIMLFIFTLKYFCVWATFMFLDCATSWREYLRCAMLERHQTGPPCWSQQSKGEKSNCIVFSMALTTTNIVEGKWLNKVLHLNPKMGWSRHSGIQRSSQPIFWTNPWLSRGGKNRQTFHERLFLQNIFGRPILCFPRRGTRYLKSTWKHLFSSSRWEKDFG